MVTQQEKKMLLEPVCSGGLQIDDPQEQANTLKRDIARLVELIRANGFKDKASMKRAESTIENLQGRLANLKRNFISE